MARLKRSSSALEQASRRLAGMRSINERLEFGDGLTLVDYEARIQALQAQISSYNTMLSGLDEMTGQIARMEQELRGYSERMLLSVAVRYGKDSLQYVQAGGKPRPAGKRGVRTTGTAATPTPTVATVLAASGETAQTNGQGNRATMN